MLDLLTGILLVGNLILTIIAFIRGWRWKSILPLVLAIAITLVASFIVGMFIGTIMSSEIILILATFINLFSQSIALLVILYMIKNKATQENIDYLKSHILRIKDKLNLKQIMVFFILMFLIWAVIVILKGFLGIEGGGNIYSFLLIVSGVISALLISSYKRKRNVDIN